MQPNQPMQMAALAPRRHRGAGVSDVLSAVALVFAIGAMAVNFVIPGPIGPQGAAGKDGAAGMDFTVNTTLQSGQNETGVYSANNGGSGGYFTEVVNFRIPLGTDIPASDTQFIPSGGAYTAQCPGPGHAQPGFLCLYEAFGVSRTYVGVANPATPPGANGASKWGFVIQFLATAASSGSYGQWTVTAP